MKRFFSDNLQGDCFILEGEEYNHAVNVMRLKIGEHIVICLKSNPDFIDYICEISSIAVKILTAKIISREKNNSEPKIKLTVFQALCKADKLELIAQKLNELGAYKLVPITTKNTVVKADTTRLDRLEKIVLESSKQCARASTLEIERVRDFSQIINELHNFDLKILAYEKEERLSLKVALKSIEPFIGMKIAVIIGSEGGFTEDEIKAVQNNGIKSVTLGKRILRAETASIAVSAMIMYEYESG